MNNIQDLKIGQKVKTPRFGNVKINVIFLMESELIESGYTEPTNFTTGNIKINGKHVGNNRMVFAATHIDRG